MMTLRIKIDHWSRGVDEEIRHHNRQILIAEYLRMPARRLWSYMHIVRYMYLSDTYFIPIRLKPEQPEDAVIYGRRCPLYLPTKCHRLTIVKPRICSNRTG